MTVHSRSTLLVYLLGGLLAAAPFAAATTFEVGPLKPYTTIGSVPWATLAPGDTVLIYARSTPYKEKWVICRQGTATQPITVKGVPDSTGKLPVIEGNGAVAPANLNYWNQERGILEIGGANVPANLMPKHIVIEGLDIMNANPSTTFTNTSGVLKSYTKNAASIYVEKGENIIVRKCRLHGSGNGLFVGSSDSEPSRSLLVEGNYLYGNGNGGSVTEHNSYTAAVGSVFQNNYYGPLRSGASGNSLKDRSSGLVVRYNWIEAANRQLDLVDAEDSIQIRNASDYRQAFVYGNVLIEGSDSGNSQIVHYGGDSGNEPNYRKGTLYFYNNTVVSKRSYHTTLVRLSTNAETIDARNNLIYATAPNGLAILDDTGTANLSRNWISSSWSKSFSAPAAIVNDNGGNVAGTSPGFLNEAAQDFRLSSASASVNVGGILNAAALPQNDVVRQYVKHQGSEPRPRLDVLDAGAFELTGSPSAPPDTQPPTVALTAPLAGVELAGTITVAGVASDLVGVTKVELYANGQLRATSFLPVFGFVLDATSLPNGPVVFSVRAYDAASNMGQATVSASINNPVVPSGPTSQTFGYGINGYPGANDVGISNSTAENGKTSWNTRHRASVYSTGVQERVLLKFAGISVPAGNRVTSASVRLGLNTWTAGMVLDGYYLASPWDESSPDIGWLKRSSVAQWLSPGASGSDRIASKTFQIAVISAIGDQTVSVQLDPAVVQQWLSNPISNQGIEITSRKLDANLFVYSWRSSTASLRPVLTITSAP